MSLDSRRVRTTLGIAAIWSLLGAAGPALGDELGRLFFTPQQRQDLDRKRAANISDEETPSVESSVTVNGHVRRSNGATTTWINGVPQYDAYRGSAADRVAVDRGDAKVGVKVGQTLDRSRGEVRDSLDGGSVRVNPGASK